MFSALRILRLRNLAFLAFALLGVLLLGYRVEVTSFPNHASFALRALIFIYVICSVTASGYIINDFFDIETDAINKPHKQVVGKKIGLKETQWLYLGILLDGVVFSSLLFWLSGKFFFTPIIVITQILLFIYAKYLKKSLLFGNLLVALLAVVPYWLVVYIFDFNRTLPFFVIVLTVSGFMLHLIREVVKDLEDVQGDRTIGARTLAIVLGENRTRRCIHFLLIATCVAHILMLLSFSFLINFHWDEFLVLFWPLLLVVAQELKMIIQTKNNEFSATHLSKSLKSAMFTGVLWIYYLLIFSHVI